MTDRYISPSGTNSGAGGIGSPWQTGTYAINAATSGDTLIFREGTYTEQLEIDKPLTLQAYPDEAVTFSGSNGTYPAKTNREAGTLNGNSYDAITYDGLLHITSSDVTVSGPFLITQSRGRGIYIVGGDDAAPSAPRISNISISNVNLYNNRHAALVVQYADAVEFLDSEYSLYGMYAQFTRNPKELNWPQGASIKRCEGFTMRGVKGHSGWGEVLGLTINLDDWLVEECEFYDGNSTIVLVHRCVNGVFQRNKVYQTDNHAYRRGTLYQMGINFNNEDQRRDDEYTITNVKILSNLVRGNRYNFSNAAGQGGQFPFSNVLIANNTLINARYGSSTETAYGVRIAGNAPLTNYRIHNNIVVQDSDGATSQPCDYNGGKDIVWSNNLWSNQPVAAARGTGDVYGAPALNSIPSAVTVVTMDPANYVKKVGSPGINAGKNLSADFTVDYFGSTITTFDMGFDEYGGTGGGGGDPEPPPPAGGDGDALVGVGYVQGTTNTTDNDLTDSSVYGGTTPKAALIVAVENGTSETNTDHAKLSYGATNGTADISINLRARDNQNPSTARAGGSGAYAAVIQADGSTSYAFAAVTAMIANGVRFSKIVAPSEAADIISMLFGGADVQTSVGTLTCPNSVGSTASVTGLSFSPNLMFFFNYALGFDDSTEAGQNISFGFATSPANQYNYSYHEYNNVTPTSILARLESGYIAREINSGTDDQAHELTSVNSDGITVTTRISNGAKTIGYLLARVDNLVVNVGTYQLGSTGLNTFAGSIRPQSLMVLQTHLTNLGTTTSGSDGAAGAFGIGFINDTTQRSVGWMSEVNVATSDTATTRSSSKLVYSPKHDATAGISGTGALTETGWTLNLTSTVSGAYGIMVQVERPADPPVRQRIRTMRQGLRHGMGWGLG